MFDEWTTDIKINNRENARDDISDTRALIVQFHDDQGVRELIVL